MTSPSLTDNRRLHSAGHALFSNHLHYNHYYSHQPCLPGGTTKVERDSRAPSGRPPHTTKTGQVGREATPCLLSSASSFSVCTSVDYCVRMYSVAMRLRITMDMPPVQWCLVQ
ncbi:hypothetical protein BaRGS_00006465 [Batillaria attramentaria]|uniref:Uncharacterized protein n=1 Tax=Batillaria attramentaria TaxID=370345 RepID=A0ABD0LU82_9CAEN